MSDVDSIENLDLEEKRALLAHLLRERFSQPRALFPLSCGQQALWFLQRLEPESAAYNVVQAWRICSAVDVSALREAFQSLVNRHPILRTTYSVCDGKPVQQVHQHQEVSFEVKDASTWSAADLNDHLAEVAYCPFDLELGPILRVHLFIRSADDHVLLLAIHHIAIDGWSLDVLLDELGQMYAAIEDGGSASLSPLVAQYSDYIRWQTKALAGPEGERLWGYWREQLGDGLPVLDLATDRLRPPTQTYQGAAYTFSLDERLCRAIRTLAEAEGVTPYVILLAAFYVLLYRYAGHNDIVIGTPMSGRTRAGFSNVVGYFVNMVALRADLSGNPTFKEFLRQVRRTVVQALEHQDYPFSLLVDRLQLERDPSRSPLFQAVFVLQKSQRLALKKSPGVDEQKNKAGGFSPSSGRGICFDIGGLPFETFSLEERVALFDLELEFVEVDGAFSACLQYNKDLFDASSIARMGGHLCILLEGGIADCSRRLLDLPILSEAERCQLLEEWNGAGVQYLQSQCIHELFETQVERGPDAVAVVMEGQSLTYGELNRRANHLAHYLQGMGVGPEVLVGICVERSFDMVVGLLGILKAGAAYLPLDPVYPEERLLFMLEDARSPVLLIQRHLLEELSALESWSCPGHDPRVVCLDRDWEMIAQGSCENPVSEAMADNLAYAIYTSGSTGRPKGVLVSHHNVMRLFEATAQWFEFDDLDVWTLFHTYAFDFSVWELWGALLHGGRLLIIPFLTSRSPDVFYALLLGERVTVLNQTPSAFRQLIRAGRTQDAANDLNLRWIIFGGEALELNSLRPWFDRYGERKPQLVNMYGITETTVHVTYRPLALRDLDVTSGSVVGSPIPDLCIYILDSCLRPVPIGVPGEIYVGGGGVSRGYLNCPGLTAERFVPNPFRDEEGARLYRTGDVARYLSDGDIEYMGRIDQQVKVRGFRIELEEVEAVLAKHPAVHEAVVLVQGDSPDKKRLVAYVVSGEGERPTSGELCRFLENSLPTYMVPAAFVMLKSLPLTSNGKINRRELLAMEIHRPELEVPCVLPSSALERAIADVWKAVLDLDRVGVHDNFFDLGGNSLLAVQVHSELQEVFEREMAMVHLFQYPTISSLAKHLLEDQEVELSLKKVDDRVRKQMQALDRRRELTRKVRTRE
jgi:amino acid adenylation domain-containing protein